MKNEILKNYCFFIKNQHLFYLMTYNNRHLSIVYSFNMIIISQIQFQTKYIHINIGVTFKIKDQELHLITLSSL